MAVLFGGQSAEHEVSCVSALHVAAAMSAQRYEVLPVGITREGRWVLPEASLHVLAGGALELASGAFEAEGTELNVFGGLSGLAQEAPRGIGREVKSATGSFYGLSTTPLNIDVVFPVLHGPLGEDGTVQGLLELAGIPYVGSGVLGSAVAMDKPMMKVALRAAGLPTARYLVLHRHQWLADCDELLSRAAGMGFPCFTKPANLGSSVGISRCTGEAELAAGLELAFRFDRKVLVEENVAGREIECAVLGNEDPQASTCGEIIPDRDFYDYEAKYVQSSSRIIVPADLPERVADEIRSCSIRAFKAVDAAGLARVDFFYEPEEDRVLVNEINTMPGFTEISMFPKLWRASGIGYPELIDRLIELALQRHRADSGAARTGAGRGGPVGPATTDAPPGR